MTTERGSSVVIGFYQTTLVLALFMLIPLHDKPLLVQQNIQQFL